MTRRRSASARDAARALGDPARPSATTACCAVRSRTSRHRRGFDEDRWVGDRARWADDDDDAGGADRDPGGLHRARPRRPDRGRAPARHARRRRRPRARSRRGWTPPSSRRCATRSCVPTTASRCAAACCSTARPAAARRSSPARSRASSARASSRSASTTCSTCGSASPSGACTTRSQSARRAAPCVLFLDELDALGQKRSHLRHSGGRNVVNQLLAELDGAQADNEGVFVLAATNHPWDVDTALRRPGRLDRTVLVLPPDLPAREAILRKALQERGRSRASTRSSSPAAPTAAPAPTSSTSSSPPPSRRCRSRSGPARCARSRSASSSRPRGETAPSTQAWFGVAHNYALYANDGGQYDDLLAYIRRTSCCEPRGRPSSARSRCWTCGVPRKRSSTSTPRSPPRPTSPSCTA